MSSWAVAETRFGAFRVCVENDAVVRVLLPGSDWGAPEAPASPHEDRLLGQAVLEIQEWAEGRRQRFTLPLATQGTPFQQAVWEELARIPYGQTRTYGQVAAAVGRPGAARAVGQANHRNPVAPLIPCHRVVASTGLGGYGGGAGLKQAMLEMERQAPSP